tara:strand:+ start:607 stop:750 length:144 start_codon:yes stop_codon:yes gene_type:complete
LKIFSANSFLKTFSPDVGVPQVTVEKTNIFFDRYIKGQSKEETNPAG